MMKKRVFCILTVFFCLIACLTIAGPSRVQASSIEIRVTCSVIETCYKGVKLKGSISSTFRVSEIGFEYQINAQGSWYPVDITPVSKKFTSVLSLGSYDTNNWKFRAYCIRGGITYRSDPTPLTTLPAEPPRFLFILREPHATWALVDLTIYPNDSNLLTVGYHLSIALGLDVRQVNVVTTDISATTTLHLEITDLEPNTNYIIKGIYTNMLSGTRYGNSAGFSTSSSDDPTPTSTPSITPTPSATPRPTPTISPRPSATPSPSPTPSPTPTPTPTPSPTLSPTLSPSPTPVSSPTPAPTGTDSHQLTTEATVIPSDSDFDNTDLSQDKEQSQSDWLLILILGLAAAGVAAVVVILVGKKKGQN